MLEKVQLRQLEYFVVYRIHRVKKLVKLKYIDQKYEMREMVIKNLEMNNRPTNDILQQP
jgi:hypothetical protein